MPYSIPTSLLACAGREYIFRQLQRTMRTVMSNLGTATDCFNTTAAGTEYNGGGSTHAAR